jgi:hypothetical protein
MLRMAGEGAAEDEEISRSRQNTEGNKYEYRRGWMNKIQRK